MPYDPYDDDMTVGQVLGLIALSFAAIALLVGALYGIGWGFYLLWDRVICESLIVCR
jgi:hypothetical protein